MSDTFEEGRYGELFVEKYCDQLIPNTGRMMDITDLKRENIKGADFGCYAVRIDNKPIDDVMNHIFKELGIEKEEEISFVTHIVKGTVEVKQNGWEEGTARNNVSFDTIPVNFEIREKIRDGTSSPGWLRAMMFPEEANRYREKKKKQDPKTKVCRAIRNISLVYLLRRYQKKEEEPKYYAAISFYNIPALIKRLKKLMPPDWNLNDVSTIEQTKSGNLKDTKSFDNGTCLSMNQWYVPLEMLEDLAIVTLIDDPPEKESIGARNGCDEKHIDLDKRVEHLIRLANGKKINTDEPFEEKDKDAEHQYIGAVTVVATHLGLIKSPRDNRIIIKD